MDGNSGGRDRDGDCSKKVKQKQTCFSEEALGSMFHFQIVEMVDQLYIWIGLNAGRMGDVYVAMPTRFDPVPSLTVLIGGGGSDTTGASFARRLALKTGWTVMLAFSLPANSSASAAFAEKRLMQELKTMGLISRHPMSH